MDSLESILSRVVQNLPLPAFILKEGKVLETNDLMTPLGEIDELAAIVNERDENDTSFFHRLDDSNYQVRIVSLDDHGDLILCIKSNTFEVVYDELTGALDRDCFEGIATQLIEAASLDGRIVAFLFLDLDGFKQVNDTWGHEAGDTVLKKTTERITYTIRRNDYCFRFGGDEFLVVLVDLKDRIHSCLSARRLLAAISEPISLGSGEEIQVGASIGISSFPADGQSLDVLTGKADEAMYRAKKAGKNSYRLCG
jgi:diguanylate cyclase (GGDEF)-like protein